MFSEKACARVEGKGRRRRSRSLEVALLLLMLLLLLVRLLLRRLLAPLFFWGLHRWFPREDLGDGRDAQAAEGHLSLMLWWTLLFLETVYASRATSATCDEECVFASPFLAEKLAQQAVELLVEHVCWLWLINLWRLYSMNKTRTVPRVRARLRSLYKMTTQDLYACNPDARKFPKTKFPRRRRSTNIEYGV